MDALLLVLLLTTGVQSKRLFCDRSKSPLEIGEWTRDFVQLDTATIENPPVTVMEGQIYVYENFFPNHTIRYIHVDNLAIKSCGASASIKTGGVNTNGVMIVLHSGPYQEIRSVIDIWGTKDPAVKVHKPPHFISAKELEEMNKMRSKYLFKELRRFNHNYHNDTIFE